MKSKTLFIVLGLFFFAVVIPLPFKPSLWSVYKEFQLKNQLKKSSDPVYITKTGDFEPSFTIFGKWKNAYYINTGVRYYQLSPRSVIGADSEGPNREEADFLKKIQAGTECPKTSEEFAYCFMSETKEASKREFVTTQIDDYKLISELTTIYYKEGITTEGGYHLNYKRIDDADVKLVLETMRIARPVPIEEARLKYFKPVY